jgi:hypothetical protein
LLDRVTMYNNEEKTRYDRNKEWYNIKEIGSLFQITNTICKKRLGLNKSHLIEGETIKSLKSKRGKRTHLYNYSILNDIFGVRNKPKDIKKRSVKVNFIGTSKWDYIGFITPQRSNLIDLKHKMEYLYNQLILKYGKKSGIKLFYSFEQNTNDEYYHCHFLIYSKKKMEEITHLNYLLEIIGGDKNKYETPFILREYDYLNYGYTGSFYSFKDKSVFDELLG